jgi:hypothetical protein
VLRVLSPSTRGKLAELLSAQQTQGADSLVAQLGAAFLTAARNGIKFKINDPRESAEILEGIESQPVSRVRSLVFWRITLSRSILRDKRRNQVTPADLLKRALAGTQGRTTQPVTDEFAGAIARKLESRGIAVVPGLTEDEPEDTLEDRLTRYRAAIAGASAQIPLNGMGVLRAALAGMGGGTINGEIMQGRNE